VAITTLPDVLLAAMQLATNSAAERVQGLLSQVGIGGGGSSAAMREVLRETLSFMGDMCDARRSQYISPDCIRYAVT